ncbi:MAG: hypothetical protein ABSC76_06725 [Terracidiphilus sp.]|jgi:hypothetical protein
MSFPLDVTVEFAKEHLVHRPKETLDPATSLRFAWSREHKAHLEIDGNLFYVLRGEIGTIVRIENLWNAAYMPMRMPLPPNTLSKREGCSHRRRWIEAQIVAGNGAAVVVDYDGQPRSSSLPAFPQQEDAQLRVICLPDGV